MLRIHAYIGGREVTLIGPNCPGALSPGKANVGIIPAEIFSEGASGSSRARGRSRTRSAMTRAARARQLDHRRDRRRPRRRVVFLEILAIFEADSQTGQIVMVGEIGGDEEEKGATSIEAEMSKPVIAYIAVSRPRERRWGRRCDHLGSSGQLRQKEALEAKGITCPAGRRPRRPSSWPRSLAADVSFRHCGEYGSCQNADDAMDGNSKSHCSPHRARQRKVRTPGRNPRRRRRSQSRRSRLRQPPTSDRR